MTDIEAIEIIKERIALIESNYPDVLDYREALQICINALKKQNADGCIGCAFEDVEEWEMPCRKCKRGCKDYWRQRSDE